jgi:hypothetical protein
MIELAGLPERAIQIDDVQSICTVVRERCDELERRMMEHGRAIAIAFLETHGLATEEIDRGEQLHEVTKFSRRRSPVA